LLSQLESALNTNNTTALTALQPEFQQATNSVSEVQGDLGAREQLLSQVQSELQTNSTSLQSSLSDQVNVNMADALTQLTQLQTSLQATLQVTANSLQMSLFNYLQ
jgi:flagellar hook-associated protein 3 FlgL